jgi:DNA-binding NarL/FixJ family response regulator
MSMDAGGDSTGMGESSRVAPSVPAATRRSQLCVIWVEPRDLVRDCVANCLRVAHPGFAVVEYSSVRDVDSAQSSDTIVLLSFLSTTQDIPDVAAKVSRAQDQLPQVPVIVVAESDKLSVVRKLIDLGVRGYIPTSFDFATFKEAIEFVAAGGTFVPASVLLNLGNGQVSDVDEANVSARQGLTETAPQNWNGSQEHMAAADFTPRGLAVISHPRDGKPNKLIARELAIGEGTVKIYIRRIMKKAAGRKSDAGGTGCHEFTACRVSATSPPNRRRKTDFG